MVHKERLVKRKPNGINSRYIDRTPRRIRYGTSFLPPNFTERMVAEELAAIREEYRILYTVGGCYSPMFTIC